MKHILLLSCCCCVVHLINAQTDSTAKSSNNFESLKKQADNAFSSGNYGLAQTLYDSCRTNPANEFDDYLVTQTEASSKCIGYRRAIDGICKDTNLLKACLGLHEKILDINPNDNTSKKVVVESYWRLANDLFQKWDFEKAKTYYTKTVDYADPQLTPKARQGIDSCDFYLNRLRDGFNTVEVDSLATFSKGVNAIGSILASNMIYPDAAVDEKIQGRVWLKFVVSGEGRLVPRSVEVITGIGSGCDEEAIRLVKLLNPWTPAYKKGHAVPMQFNFPIQFRIP